MSGVELHTHPRFPTPFFFTPLSNPALFLNGGGGKANAKIMHAGLVEKGRQTYSWSWSDRSER